MKRRNNILLALKDFLEIENNPEIYNYKFEFDNVLMWPFIRFKLYRMLINREYKLANLKMKKRKRNNFIENIPYIVRTIIDNPYKNYLKKYDILMFCSGITNVKRGNNYFNRISDYFALLYKDKTLLIENSVGRRYRSPRCFPNICYHDFIILSAHIQSKFIKINEKDIITIENLIKYLKQKLSNRLKKSDLDVVKNSLLHISKKLNIYHYLYNKLFDKFDPKIIFLEDAGYGVRSYILKWAKERGILTAELQHGCTSKNHPAYNYSDIILNSDIYRKYLPDYFLTYGKYWNKLINTPVKKVIIGNPNYSENINNLNVSKKNKNRKKILIISQGTMTDIFKKITIGLASLIDKKNYKILFRPHPAELPMVKEKYSEFFGIDAIELDTKTDLYPSLLDADFVVGAYSTALFEAVGICRSIFAVKHPLTSLNIPQGTFKRFSNAEELINLIQNHNLEENKVNKNYIWEPNWEDNYKKFIKETLKL